jgi:hypothetical protein
MFIIVTKTKPKNTPNKLKLQKFTTPWKSTKSRVHYYFKPSQQTPPPLPQKKTLQKLQRNTTLHRIQMTLSLSIKTTFMSPSHSFVKFSYCLWQFGSVLLKYRVSTSVGLIYLWALVINMHSVLIMTNAYPNFSHLQYFDWGIGNW